MNIDKRAIIDIGSSAIRMSIYEIKDRDIFTVDELWQSIKLGVDTFNTGKISRKQIDETLSVLKRYKKYCKELNVTDIYTVATTAVREASNIDVFLDNIKTNTGLDIDILSPNEEIQLIYNALINNKDTPIKKGGKNCIVEISAGLMNISIFADECIIYSRSLPLGSLKLTEDYHKYFSNEKSYPAFLKSTLDHELRYLKKQMPKVKIATVYGICSELEEISRIVNGDGDITSVNLADLKNLSDMSQNRTQRELVNAMKIPHDITDTLYTASTSYSRILELFGFQKIFIPDISLRDAIIKNRLYCNDYPEYFTNKMRQIKMNAKKIGEMLNFDEKHALKVSKLAIDIFNDTKEMHKMGNDDEAYLMVAAILHDVGMCISARSHHKHSLYIIKSQDFFFFDENEKNIIANIARYHRRSEPKPTHPDYVMLSQNDKMKVIKLSSILRLADALDSSHNQLIRTVKCVVKEDRVVLSPYCNAKIFSEEYAIKKKKSAFEDHFGKKIVLSPIIEKDKVK